MKSRTTELTVEFQTDAADYEIDVTYFHGLPAKLDALPENCYPEEPPEILRWFVASVQVHHADCLKDDTDERLESYIWDAVQEAIEY